MSSCKRIVARVEVLNAPAPRLVDYHEAPEEQTLELPNPYECCWELVSEDRGGSRAARREAVTR